MTNYELNEYFDKNRKLTDVSFDSVIDFEPIFEVIPLNIYFKKCSFKGFKFLKKDLDYLSITFEECVFEISFWNIIDNIKCNELKFINCEIDNVLIKNSTIEELVIVGGRFDNIDLKNLIGESCRVVSTAQSISLEIDIPDVDLTIIESNFFIASLYLKKFKNCILSGVYGVISLESSDFNSLVLKQEHHEVISKTDLFVFEDKVFTGKIFVVDFNIKELTFDNLTGIDSSVIISETSIEKTGITDCNFQEFSWNQVTFISEPFIQRSNLKGLVINDVVWPNDKRILDTTLDLDIPFFYRLRRFHKSKDESKRISAVELSDLKYEKDTYRQLKLAAKENENIYDYLLFGNYEKRLHWKLVRIEGGEKWYDIILLFTDRHVSNFGFTWWKPLFWLFFFHYLLYFISIGFVFSIDKAMLIDGFNESIVLINPAHSTPEFMHGGYEWVSLLMRISSGFFIYHFLRATRKFARY